MKTTITDVIPLPSKLRKSWRGQDVLFVPTKDTLLIRRAPKSPIASIREKLKLIGKKISKTDLARAVRAARG